LEDLHDLFYMTGTSVFGPSCTHVDMVRGLGRHGCLALTRWAGWSGVKVGRYIKC